MENLIVLPITYSFGGAEDTIYPVVLLDESDMVLVDCGYPGFLPLIEEAMERKNLDCRKLTKIVLTHHDHDHVGALAAFKRKYPRVQAVAGEGEAPYITGERKSLRLEQAEAMQETLSDEQKAFGEAFCTLLREVEPADVDRTVRNGDRFGWGGGCEIIDTPGHTSGHLSLYLTREKTVVTGDAAVLEGGGLVVANPQYTPDLHQAEQSLAKLLRCEADRYICYHGGVYHRATE